MMESTTEMSGFSSAPVDPSKFEVPAGLSRSNRKWAGGGRESSNFVAWRHPVRCRTGYFIARIRDSPA